MNISGRTALITGATGGLGNAIARALASKGATVLLTGRRAEMLDELAAETGGRALTCDLADRGAVDALIADVGDEVDIVVANAALPASGELLDFSIEQIDRALDVNLRAPIVFARVIGEKMAERGAGHLVFISSLSGKAAQGGTSIYSATKFGMRGFALGLREDLRPRGVGVSTVFPGFIRDAGMFHESGAKLPGYIGTKTPEDVARAVVTAIEKNRSEVDVAPVALRAGAVISGLVPEVAAQAARRMGSAELSTDIATGQRSKR